MNENNQNTLPWWTQVFNQQLLQNAKEKNTMEKICKNCDYYVNNYGYGQCYAQKDAPKVDDNESCADFSAKMKEQSKNDKIKSEDFIKAFGEGVKQMENVKPIVIDCKYYLPCGRCDKTGGWCSQLEQIGVQPNSFVLPTEYTTSTSTGGDMK